MSPRSGWWSVIEELDDRLVEVIDFYRDEPVAFAEDVLDFEPDPWQAEVLEAIGDGEDVAVKACHGPGKTADASVAILWFLACHPLARVPCTAPTQRQLRDVLWAEIKAWLNGSLIEDWFNFYKTQIRASGFEKTWFATAASSSNPDNLAGYHAENLLYVIDEAGGVPDNVFEVVEGALTNEGAQILLIGNPVRADGYFFRIFEDMQDRFELFTISADDSPRVDDEFKEKIARSWGRDSDAYRIRVLAEFPKSGGSSLIPYSQAHKMVEVDTTGDNPDLSPVPERVDIGVDVARKGTSETVIIDREGPVVTNMAIYTKKTLVETAGNVWDRVRRHNNREEVSEIYIKVDDGGVGGGVTDQLEATIENHQFETDIHLVPCLFGESVANDEKKDKLQNSGAEMWMNIKKLLEKNQIALPDHVRRNDERDIISQISGRKAKQTPSGKLKLESKEDMEKRGRPSPDRADALCLAFYEPGQVEDEVEIVTPAVDSLETTSYWKQAG